MVDIRPSHLINKKTDVGHLFRRHRTGDSRVSRVSLSVRRYHSREGSELGEDSHQEFLAILDVQLAVDSP